MKQLRLPAPLLVALAVAGPARAETDEPTTDPEASKAFEVRLAPGTTNEDVTERIIEAGLEQLATACALQPGASVRIFNPLASGSYEDVACSTISNRTQSVGPTSEALTSDGESIGQAQQDLTPVGLLCGLFTIGLGLAATWSCDKYPDQWCPWPAAVGTSGVSLACMFL